jgi:uracil-DNA glycosylase
MGTSEYYKKHILSLLLLIITVSLYAFEGDNVVQREIQNYQFPFGQYLQEVKQINRTPKKVFVLGVYASAVHAEWHSSDGRMICRALAVASEPYIFWRGNRKEAETIISSIKIPDGLGYLSPADNQFNGPSGRALDEKILAPLGYSRDDAWLCDLVPYSCQNINQRNVLNKNYVPIQDKLGLPRCSIPQVPKILADENRRNEILQELIESHADTIILLGDEPVKWFLNYCSDCKTQKLSDFDAYGARIKTIISGREYDVIPLAHPRQIAAMGKSSQKWYALHQQWMQKTEG